VKSVSALLSTSLTHSLVTIGVAMLLTWVAVRLLRRLVRNKVSDGELRYRASKLAGLLGYVVIVIVIIAEVGGRLSGFTVAVGAAGAGVAFALQEVIASFAGWLAVALGGFYKVGDRVQLGGIKGDVIDIGFIRTTIMETGSWVNGDLYNGRIVRVTNSFVFKEPVFNYSGDFPFVWDEIVVPVKYGSDYELARAMLTDIAREVVGEYTESARARWEQLVRAYRIENARIEPSATLIANDNWVELTLRYVVDHRARRTTKDALFTRILSAIEGSDGKVAMASMTVHIVEAPELRVALSERSKARDGGVR
jgi:small-conductance mechanosensitive channel